MPPEPLPWDRKDYPFKDYRKHDGLGASGGGTSSSFMPRWRDAYHGPRDFPRGSPRRPPPGHYRQGGFYHQTYSEDPGGYGCTPSRSDRLWPEDDNFRSSSSGRYGGGRNVGNRDSRGNFRRSPFWDSGDFSRQHYEAHVTGPRSVTVPISSASQPPLKDQNDKTGGIDDGLATGHRFYHRDRSSWKKWGRPGSSSSAKADRSETEDAVCETSAPPGKGNSLRSPSPQPSADDPPKKKPRLGWGQGLAKYEKLKVEGTSDVSENVVIGLNDASLKVSGPPVCVSPATPCSAACCSTLEEKPCIQYLSGDDDNCYKSNSSGGLPDVIPIKLEHLGTSPITALTSVLSDLLQHDVFSADLTFTKQSSLNKVLMLKEDISKELEKTECEIDLLDNELKALACDAGNHPGIVTKSASSALESCEEQCIALISYSNLNAPNTESITDIVSMKDSHHCGDSNKESDLQAMNMAKVESQVSLSGVIPSASLMKEISDAFFKSSDECSISLGVDMPRVIEVQQISLTDTEDGKVTACGNEKTICSEGHVNSLSGILDTSTNAVSDLTMSATVADNDDLMASTKTMQMGTYSDIWQSVNFQSCRENDLKIREKLLFHKGRVKFKERMLALKFRALHHLWKEDLRLLSLRKHRPKSNKRLELGGLSLRSGYQKQHCSIKTRFVMPDNTSLLPTTEIINFATTLLSDSHSKLRSNLKMPALTLNEERFHTRFVTYNAFVEDPVSFEKEKSMINPWSREEKEVVMEMLVKYGKDFTKISSYLQHKTTADCIEFYYKNHKSEMFKEVKERLDLRKRQQQLPANTYLVTSGKKWNRETNAASVGLIGASSVVASQSLVSGKSKHKYAGKTVYGVYHDWEVSRMPYNCTESMNSIEELNHEKELFGICGALSSEAVSSCVTNSTDPAGKVCNMMVYPDCKAEISEHFDEEVACSDENFMVSLSNDWSDEEKSIFIQALSTYGKDFTKISSCVKSRSREQCKVFYSKARKCLGLDLIHQEADCKVQLIDKNRGMSDTDDACATEIDSATCSIQSCSKLNEGISHGIINASTEGFTHDENILQQQSKADDTSKQELMQEIQVKEIEEKDGCTRITICHHDTSVHQQNSSQYSISSKGKAKDILACNDNKDDHDAAVYADKEIKMECSIDVETIEDESKKAINIAGGTDPVFAVKMEVDSKPLSVAQNELMNTQCSSICFTQTNGSFQGFAVDQNMNNESAVIQGKKADQCSQITFLPNYQHHPQLDLLYCLPKDTQIFSLKQEDSHPSSICFGTELNVSPQSSLNFEEPTGVRYQNVISRDTYKHCVDRTRVVNQVNGQVHVLRGSQLQMLNQEIKREEDKISNKPALFETEPIRNGGPNSNLSFLSDIGGNSGSVSRDLSSRSGKLCPSESAETQLKPCVLKSSSDSEEQKSRDVKLFGTVLSRTLSQKSNSSLSECGNKPPSQVPNMSSVTSSSKGNKGSEDRIVGKYGVLGDNRIQSGFTSSP